MYRPAKRKFQTKLIHLTQKNNKPKRENRKDNLYQEPILKSSW